MADEEVQPRDAKLVKSVLQSMGVEQYEPRVVNMFLDFSYRYVVDVLEDAQVYSEHAGKSGPDPEDVKLAIQARVNQSFSQPPPRETLMELAKLRNSYPLPRIIGGPGLALPPDQDTLTAPNYQLAAPSKTFSQGSQLPINSEQDHSNKNGSANRDAGSQRPTQLQRTEQDRKVSFAISTKRLKN